MASAATPNNPLNNIENNIKQQPQQLSVAISYETELTSSEMSEEASVSSDLNSVEAGNNGTDDKLAVMTNELLDEPVEVTNELLFEADEQQRGVTMEEEADNEQQLSTRHDEHKQAADESEQPLPDKKRRGRPLGSVDTAPRKKKKAADTSFTISTNSWEDVLSKIQQRLDGMDSDECFAKAIQLSNLARRSVESRGSAHLLAAFDMLGKSSGLSVSSYSSLAVAVNSEQQKQEQQQSDELKLDPMQQWMQRFVQLAAFHQKHGHFDVPSSCDEDLGHWVSRQKNCAEESTLNSTQLHLLGTIGFLSVDSNDDDDAKKRQQQPQLDNHDTAERESTIFYPQLLANNKNNNKATTAAAAHQPSSPPTTTKHRTTASQKQQRGQITQKQIKLHRTTRFATIEAVPSIKMPTPLPPKADSHDTNAMAVPEFTSLVNFPNARFSAKCVMCDEDEYAIPNQNKGVCNNCDSAVWIYVENGMQIKWCKGCKNFRRWVDFGDKVSLMYCLVFMKREKEYYPERGRCFLYYYISHVLCVNFCIFIKGTFIQVSKLSCLPSAEVCC